MKIRTILPFALILALLTGCAEDEATTLNVSGEPMTFCIAQNAQTRAVNLAGTAWDGGEEVAVSIGGEVKKYVVVYNSMGNALLQPASGVTPFTWSSKTETKTVTAWYPYADTKPAVTVPANQVTEAKLRAAIMLEATVSGVTYGTTAALPFTHRTAKVTIRPLDADNGNVMQADAIVTLKNLSGVSDGLTRISPLRNADNSYTAIIAPQTIADGTVFASISNVDNTWNYKPGATTFAAASAYTFNVSYSDPYNGHAYVDMGNGLKWATCNLGATNPEDYGDYYAWGETATKDNYSFGTYRWMQSGQSGPYYITKYTFADGQASGIWYDSGGNFIGDNKRSFADDGYADDAARANWGGTWRTPTDAEWTWLRTNCTWTWTTQSGVNGMLVRSNVAGYTDNTIFLPAAGRRRNAGFDLKDSNGMYCSSSLADYSYYARYVNFYWAGDNFAIRSQDSRDNGYSIRPVSN